MGRFLEQTHFPSIAEVGFRFPFRDRKEARYLVHYVQELSPRVRLVFVLFHTPLLTLGPGSRLTYVTQPAVLAPRCPSERSNIRS